ncbi:MAG: GMC oxidoreductase, partial [Cyanobacteria bacterium P01_H01_bin.15]
RGPIPLEVLAESTSDLDKVIKSFKPDVIVFGAGKVGLFLATELFEKGLRVLVLDKGNPSYSHHISRYAHLLKGQNIADIGRWQQPWVSNVNAPGLAIEVGGKANFWALWSPQLVSADFLTWPSELVKRYEQNTASICRQLNIGCAPELLMQALHEHLKENLKRSQRFTVSDAPYALLHPKGFTGYSPASAFHRALEKDWFDSQSATGLNPSTHRRLLLVSGQDIKQLHTYRDKVIGITVASNGILNQVDLPSACLYVIANSTVEATRLSLQSFPTQPMGTNLMVHTRSNLQFRLPEGIHEWGTREKASQGASFHLASQHRDHQFHLQLGTIKPGNDPLILAKLSNLVRLKIADASEYPECIYGIVRAVGEMKGSRNSPCAKSYITLSDQLDIFGFPKAYVHIETTLEEEAVWSHANQAMTNVAQLVAGSNRLEFEFNGQWSETLPLDWETQVRHGLGTTHHEAGTLYSGTDPFTSVVNCVGQFHHVKNCYVVGGAVLPTAGSANPCVPILTLTRVTAQAIAERLQHRSAQVA